MDEFSFIRSIQQKTYKQPSIIKGVGDDAAVFRQTSQDIITAMDTFVEGVHFTRETMDPFHMGYRVLAANISDMAAMGAMPAFYLVSIVIPETWSEADLFAIYKGMKHMAAVYSMDLIGGDTVAGKELSITVSVIGYADKHKARYRSDAEAGDIVFVTGTLGDSQAGYHILTNPAAYKDENYYIKKHRMPSPRVAFATALAVVQRVALNDISDGIANEAAEIAQASNTFVHIFSEKLPVSNSFHQFSSRLQWKWKLFGGEDFELLGTVSEKDWSNVKKVAEKTKTPITEIGYVGYNVNKDPYVLLHEENQIRRLEKHGFNHLK